MSRIDELFTSLKQSPVEYPLEEVMAHLEKAVAATSGSSALMKWMLNKKFTIMFSLIGCAALGIALMLNTGNAPKEKTISTIENNRPTHHVDNDVPLPNAGNTETTRSIKEDLEREEFQVEMDLLPLKKLKPKRLEIPMTSFQPYMVYDPQEDDFIPTLNAEQRAANEKQKQKMLKSLGKRDKKEWAFMPSGKTSVFGQFPFPSSLLHANNGGEQSRVPYFFIRFNYSGSKGGFLKSKTRSSQMVVIGSGYEPNDGTHVFLT